MILYGLHYGTVYNFVTFYKILQIRLAYKSHVIALHFSMKSDRTTFDKYLSLTIYLLHPRPAMSQRLQLYIPYFIPN
jgi:hypothetical protein